MQAGYEGMGQRSDGAPCNLKGSFNSIGGKSFKVLYPWDAATKTGQVRMGEPATVWEPVMHR